MTKVDQGRCHLLLSSVFSAAAERRQRCWRGSPGVLALLPLLIFYYPRSFIFLLFFGQPCFPSPSAPPASSLTSTCSPSSSTPSAPHPFSLYPPLPPPAIHGGNIGSGWWPTGCPRNRIRWSLSGSRHPSTKNS